MLIAAVICMIIGIILIGIFNLLFVIDFNARKIRISNAIYFTICSLIFICTLLGAIFGLIEIC